MSRLLSEKGQTSKKFRLATHFIFNNIWNFNQILVLIYKGSCFIDRRTLKCRKTFDFKNINIKNKKLCELNIFQDLIFKTLAGYELIHVYFISYNKYW